MVLWWTVVAPGEAHVVVTPRDYFIASSDMKVATPGRHAYFAIPSSIPFVGRKVRRVDLTIKEIIFAMETIEKDQARYLVDTSTKYRVLDVKTAAETFITDTMLAEELREVIKASVRAVTVKYSVTEVRAMKQKMEEEVRHEMEQNFRQWGIELTNFQFVDFRDTGESKIISNISRRREVEIETSTREINADKIRQARMKEADAEEKAREREIAKDKVIAERQQNMDQAISEQRKLAKEKEFEVVRTVTIKQAEINKEQAAVQAEQQKVVAVIQAAKDKDVMTIEKETANIEKDKKELEGQGERLKAEQIAIGDAAKQLHQLLAEAEGKTELQKALSGFDDKAIRAMISPLMIDMQQTVGVATANALKEADIRLFSGTGAGQQGFDLGQLIASASVSNDKLADAILNKIARPNDLGLKGLELSGDKQ